MARIATPAGVFLMGNGLEASDISPNAPHLRRIFGICDFVGYINRFASNGRTRLSARWAVVVLFLATTFVLLPRQDVTAAETAKINKAAGNMDPFPDFLLHDASFL
jgi:hypothetical protein